MDREVGGKRRTTRRELATQALVLQEASLLPLTASLPQLLQTKLTITVLLPNGTNQT